MGLSRDIGKKWHTGCRSTGPNIFGGARYLSLLYELQPDYLKQEDKLRFAIAAYNFGMDHLIDARNLAILQNKTQYLGGRISCYAANVPSSLLQRS